MLVIMTLTINTIIKIIKIIMIIKMLTPIMTIRLNCLHKKLSEHSSHGTCAIWGMNPPRPSSPLHLAPKLAQLCQCQKVGHVKRHCCLIHRLSGGQPKDQKLRLRPMRPMKSRKRPPMKPMMRMIMQWYSRFQAHPEEPSVLKSQ